MEISRYLAMTAAETDRTALPEGFSLAYMACHFSPYSTGLTNLPTSIPEGSMLILNDRTPIYRHDPGRILAQLTRLQEEVPFSSLLLDFQRPNQQDTEALCRVLTQQLPCPVGVSEMYARELEAPVFLPPLPLGQDPGDLLRFWQGREIWLDTAPQAAGITVTESGSIWEEVPYSPPPEHTFSEETLHCRYRAEVTDSRIRFHLWRDFPTAMKLPEVSVPMGVTRMVALYQDWERMHLPPEEAPPSISQKGDELS